MPVPKVGQGGSITRAVEEISLDIVVRLVIIYGLVLKVMKPCVKRLIVKLAIYYFVIFLFFADKYHILVS